LNAQDLKNSILQLAVQGKFVGQRAEEGTARELLEQIAAEKAQLIKEGKIKKEKPLPEITEEEIPFEIPETWEWVRLGDISSYAQTKKKISPNDIRDDMWSLDLEDVEKNTGAILNKVCVSERKISGDKVIFEKGNILYSKLRPYLLKILVAPDDGICTSELVPFDTYGEIYNRYVMWVLKAPHVNFAVNAVSYGVKMPRVGTETMVNLLVPLPPLEEQHRIVTKIEEIIPYIDQYDKAYTKLEIFNKKFPEDMKKSILQMAMQGKLVEQRPEEGNADELYEKIVAGRAQLIKDGKIKKEKPLPEITEDEIPFEIPSSWKWVRFSEVMDVRDGTHDSPKYIESGIPLVTSKNISGGGLDFSNVKYISREDADKINERSNVDSGDILFAMIGSIGNPVIVNKDREFCVKNVALFKNYDKSKICIEYVYWFLYREQYTMKKVASGGVQSFISLKIFRNYLFPLPPLEEQKRIVAKIEELLPYCDQLIK
jgi:type I restriction enzyme, S subunit